MTKPKPYTGGHFQEGNSGNPGTDWLNSDWLHIQGRKDRGEDYEDICPTCDGKGKTDDTTCTQCTGNGIVMVKGTKAKR
jgi:DnaJ-class molecular chaperone